MLTERQSRASAEIARSLEMGIAVSHGVLLTKGVRFRRPDDGLAPPDPQRA